MKPVSTQRDVDVSTQTDRSLYTPAEREALGHQWPKPQPRTPPAAAPYKPACASQYTPTKQEALGDQWPKPQPRTPAASPHKTANGSPYKRGSAQHTRQPQAPQAWSKGSWAQKASAPTHTGPPQWNSPGNATAARTFAHTRPNSPATHSRPNSPATHSRPNPPAYQHRNPWDYQSHNPAAYQNRRINHPNSKSGRAPPTTRLLPGPGMPPAVNVNRSKPPAYEGCRSNYPNSNSGPAPPTTTQSRPGPVPGPRPTPPAVNNVNASNGPPKPTPTPGTAHYAEWKPTARRVIESFDKAELPVDHEEFKSDTERLGLRVGLHRSRHAC